MKQSIFEVSEDLKQWEGKILKKRGSFHWFSGNSELETTWISLIGWPHKTSNIAHLLPTCIFWHRAKRLENLVVARFNWLPTQARPNCDKELFHSAFKQLSYYCIIHNTNSIKLQKAAHLTSQLCLLLYKLGTHTHTF